MTGIDWQGVRDRVLALRQAPGADATFAAFAHWFELDPALSEAEIQDAEDFLGVRLPADYRGFLRHVAAGGAGPAYGIFPLRRQGNGWRWDAEPHNRTDIRRLREPFAPSHIDGVEIDPQLLRPIHPWTFEYRDEEEEHRREWRRIIFHPDRTAGAIRLCDQGCFQNYWLVVTGEERGMIWRDLRSDTLDLAPLFDTRGNRMTFGRWYLTWLERIEQTRPG